MCETQENRTYYGIYNVPTRKLKLVIASMLCIYITLSLRCLMTPIFLLIDQSLYKKKWTLEVNKNNGFHYCTVQKWTILVTWSSQRKGFGRFLAWKNIFNSNNLLNGSIQIKFYHSIFLLMCTSRKYPYPPLPTIFCLEGLFRSTPLEFPWMWCGP